MTGITGFVKRCLPVCFVLYVVSLATSMSGMEIFSSLLIVGVFTVLFFDPPAGFSWSLPAFGWPILLFLIVVVLGIALGPATPDEKLYDLGRMRFFLTYAALYFYLRWLSGSPRTWMATLAVVCTVIGVYGFLQHFIPMDLVRPAGKKVILYALPDEKKGPLVLGTFNHHLTFSGVYLFYASLFLALGLLRRPRSWASLGLGGLLSLLCLWTDSRMAWVAVPLVLLVLFLPLGRKAWVGLVVALILALGLLVARDTSFTRRFERTFSAPKEEYTYLPRARLWKMQWELFRRAPLVGIGWNNNERYCADYFKEYFPDTVERFCGHAHSNFLQILSTTGVLGLVAFCLVWAMVVLRLLATHRLAPRGSLESALSWGVLAGFVGFHVQGLTQWNFGDAEVLHNVMFFWAVAATLPAELPKWESAFRRPFLQPLPG